ncbi:glycosyltransferase family 61 protein [Bombella saccharophila]|uniref:Glycosyltransferase family 61 protein n=1 Tax=Bombella saccharophila TaxID=2967338 RepID=A0ABT3W419_9PROT|nr:glycosyltransferase family 61 protein [Bombella saccharophila]MCX5613782.1 glycosyltransferase family 61 protein [Bombella saccharophila]
MMTLSDCPSPALQGNVLPGQPEVQLRRNVLYVPRAAGGRDTEFGLFSETGRQLLDHALFSRYPQKLKSQGITTALMPSPYRLRVEGNVVYGGVIGDHYGHFITECLSVLWYCIENPDPERRILFHSDLTVEEIFSIPWMAEFLSYCQIKPEQILLPHLPVIIESLVLPGQGFSEDGFIYEGYGQSCRLLGECALPLEMRERKVQPIYLSRAALKGGTRQLVNEEALIHALQQRGVKIIVPEMLSVREQISLFACHPVIGIMGSAWHTAIFTDYVCGVALCFDDHIYRSFPLMDAVHDTRLAYVRVKAGGQRAVDPAPGFKVACVLEDPEAVANALLVRLSQLMRDEGASEQESAFSLHPTLHQTVEIFRLYSALGEPVTMHTAYETVACCEDVSRWHVPVLALIVGEAAFLCAEDDMLPCMGILHDGGGPFLSYRVMRGADGAVSLQHPETGLWLKAPPAHVGLPLHSDGTEVLTWEQFTLRPYNVAFERRGRLQEALTLLEEKCLFGTWDQQKAHHYGLMAAWQRVFKDDSSSIEA